jgi:HAMP domain-containing protein
MRLLRVWSAVAVAVCLWAPAGTRAAEVDPMERLLDAIAQVESRNDPNAVGDSGRAIGVYQIHRPYWQDGTRILGVDWSYRDASDPAKARQVVRAYLQHYGRDRNLIDMARIHNGGPKGHEKKSTRDYARKVETILSGRTQPS